MCKAGFAGDYSPKAIFSSVVASPRLTTQNLFDLVNSHHGHHYIGDDAQAKRGILKLRYPIQRGIITNWDDMEKIWEYTFYNKLDVEPDDQPVLLTDGVLEPRINREKIAEIMFERFNTPAVFIANPGLLSMHASGRTTGIVLESGDGVTQAIPVYKGNVIKDAISIGNICGRDLTEYMFSLLMERDLRFKNSSSCQEIAREIKEKCCYVASDFEHELAMLSSNLEKTYKFSDGQMITICDERFKSPEMLFKNGIHKLVLNSIMNCENYMRNELFANILLSGDSTLFPGFVERMQKEIKALAPRKTLIRIDRATEHKYASWLGGSQIALLPSFQPMWISKRQYDESGPAIIHKKAIFNEFLIKCETKSLHLYEEPNQFFVQKKRCSVKKKRNTCWLRKLATCC